jgi:hypothetical protein
MIAIPKEIMEGNKTTGACAMLPGRVSFGTFEIGC